MIERLADALKLTVSESAERKAKGGVPYIGIPTGFTTLDSVSGGLRRNNVYVLAARTGMGKSAFALSVLSNVAKMGYKSLFVSLEMSNEILALRMLSGITEIDAQKIEYGRITDEEFNRVVVGQEQLLRLPIFLLDQVVTSDQVVEQANRIKDLELLVVDYASLLSDSYGDSEVDRVSYIVRRLRNAATTLNIPILEIAQLNRNVEHRDPPIPNLSDLKDSGRYEEDASMVIFLYRPAYYSQMESGFVDNYVETDAKIIIAKNRFGPTGTQSAKFYPRRMFWEQ